eukprot:7185329-Pyramimonas_sp.AAC.1
MGSLFDDRISSLPDDMRCSLMVFLPKGTGPRDTPGQSLSLSAAYSRPLSLGSTDVKLLANACVSPVVDSTFALIGQEQKCAGGRVMLGNVVRAETCGVMRRMNDDKHAAILLADFAAAFPSLARDWMFFVLR